MIFDSLPGLLGASVVLFAHGAEKARLNLSGSRDEETRNFNRATHGAAGLALAAYMLNATTADLGGYGRLFLFFARPLVEQRWQVWVCLIFWSLLVLSSATRFLVGIGKPGRRDIMECMTAIALLALVGGAWIWGAFWPPDWLAAADINLGLRFLYIYFIAFAIAGIFVSLRSATPSTLPDPSAVPGFPISRPASPDEASKALRGRATGTPPKFRD